MVSRLAFFISIVSSYCSLGRFSFPESLLTPRSNGVPFVLALVSRSYISGRWLIRIQYVYRKRRSSKTRESHHNL